MILAYPKISPKILCIYLQTFHSSLCHSLCTRLSPPYHNRLWTRWPPLYLYLYKHWTVTRIDITISNPNPSFLLFINCHNIILFICSAPSRAEPYRFQLRNLETKMEMVLTKDDLRPIVCERLRPAVPLRAAERWDAMQERLLPLYSFVWMKKQNCMLSTPAT